MKTKQTVTTALFLLCLGLGFALLLRGLVREGGNSRALVRQVVRTESFSQAAEALTAGAEGAANRDLDVRHFCVQLFGGVERLMGRRVVQDADQSLTVVKLDSGALQFVDLSGTYVDASGPAHALADFADRLEQRGIPLLYVNAPQKIPRGDSPLPEGVTEYGNQMGDALVETLKDRGVETLDLRDSFEGTPDYAAWFFRTDHHWKPAAAFFAYQTLAPVLEAHGIHTDPRCLERESYEVKAYEDWFLGSQGKRVGPLYAGVDDFEWWTPKEQGRFTLDVEEYGIHREGSWDEALLFPERMEVKDWFNGNPYTLYSGGDYPLATIVNHNNPAGADMVLIRDSMACALTPFLAQSCRTLTTIDLRYFTGDLEETVAALDPALVMVLYSTTDAKVQEMFDFG